MTKALTDSQIAQFHGKGCIDALPVFNAAELEALNQGLAEELKLLEEGETTKEIREWHEASRFLYDICMNEKILDYVECLLGPNFYLWASNFFIKEPRSLESVTWHQDAYYWPLDPRASLTVWLAFDDVDKENGAMEIIPGSHKGGIFTHNRLEGAGDSVLDLECDTSGFDLSTVENIKMKAGDISIHSDQLIHGSPGNPSDRRRAGLTIRYSPTNVKCDLSINPNFKVYQARGTDTYNYNPKAEVPTEQYGRLYRQHLSIEEAGEEAEAKTWKKN